MSKVLTKGARCPHCHGERIGLFETVEVRQEILDYDEDKVIVAPGHEVVSDDEPAEVEHEIRCADCHETIDMPDDCGVEVFNEYAETERKLAEGIRALVERRMAEEARDAGIVEEIETILRNKFHGKKITKRLATLVEQAHPDWTVHYDRPDKLSGSCGLLYLNIWGGTTGRTHNDRMHILIAYANEMECYDADKFKERAACYFAGKDKRLPEREATLNSDAPEQIARAMMDMKRSKMALSDVLDGLCDKAAIAEIGHEDVSRLY